jgi:hypothetical protein
MADNKDSSGSKGGKPADSASSAKKPKPLLDLKATEVEKPSSPSSALKGAPDWKAPAASDKTASSKADAAKGVGSKGASSPSTASKLESVPSASAGKSASSSVPSSSSGASTGAAKGAATGASQSSTASSPSQKSGAAAASAKTGNDKSKSSGGAGSPPPGRQSSGGGFFSTMTHLAAGVIGGGIALYAAGPLEKEFGINLARKAEMPAQLEQRLAALEAKQSSGGDVAGLRTDVTQLRTQMTAARDRLAKLETLGKQVASLSSDFKKVQTSGGSQPTAGNSGATAASGSADGPETSLLRTRLAKLESAFTTLSSATGGSTKTPGIAPLAQFSAKFADLESSLSTQLATLRKSLMSEVDGRISSTTASTSKAVAGAERLDREVAEIKTETARLDQRAKVLKSASDKLSASMRAIGDQAAELKVELDALKGDVKQELTKVARPDDVKNAITPVTEKVAMIEKNLGSVLANENARKQNAERIVLSLELSNLKRVLDRGAPYAAELADVKKIAGSAIDFSSLEAHKNDGVPSGQQLVRQFSDVAYRIINAEQTPKNGSRIDRLLAAAKSIVQVRRTDIPAKEKTAEAAVARIDKHLKQGDMSGALSLAEKLPDNVKAPARQWLSKLAARAGVDQAIAKIENQLKASLGTGAAATDKKS